MSKRGEPPCRVCEKNAKGEERGMEIKASAATRATGRRGGRGGRESGLLYSVGNQTRILSGQGLLSGMPAAPMWKLSLRATTLTSELNPAGDPR